MTIGNSSGQVLSSVSRYRSNVYAMMASWGQIGGLLERKNARLQAERES